MIQLQMAKKASAAWAAFIRGWGKTGLLIESKIRARLAMGMAANGRVYLAGAGCLREGASGRANNAVDDEKNVMAKLPFEFMLLLESSRHPISTWCAANDRRCKSRVLPSLRLIAFVGDRRAATPTDAGLARDPTSHRARRGRALRRTHLFDRVWLTGSARRCFKTLAALRLIVPSPAAQELLNLTPCWHAACAVAPFASTSR